MLNIVPDFLQTVYIIHSPSLVDWVSPKKKKSHQDEYHRPRNHQEAQSKAHVLRLVTGTTHVATQSTKLSHDQFNSCLCILLSSFKSRIYMNNIGTQQFSKKSIQMYVLLKHQIITWYSKLNSTWIIRIQCKEFCGYLIRIVILQ